MNRTAWRPLTAALFVATMSTLQAAPGDPPRRYAKPAADGERVGCYISTGDNNVLFRSPPVDSRAAIDSVFDILKNVYGVKVLYWRALQSDQMRRYGVTRPENFLHSDFVAHEKHLNEDLGLGRYGVQAARERGMQVWGVGSLFDHGAHAVVDASKGYGPLFYEDVVRVKHPEWVPIDRHGLRRMAGPVCFEYPEARRELVKMYLDLAATDAYDGIMFHLYVEQFFIRFPDEFVFNPAIVKAYQERYGVDMRSEPFDPYALANLRGEYLTEFFRELKAALAPRGIKVGFFLDPQNPDYPQPWLADRNVMVSGRVKVDWRRYIREGLVDEIMVYCNGDLYPTLNNVLQETRGTKCGVSTLHSAAFPETYKHLRSAGVVRTIAGGYEGLECGRLAPQPAEALGSKDFVDRLTVLNQMHSGTTPADLDAIVAATRDPNVLVRRRAIAALGKLGAGNDKAIAALEACLADPENTVRCYAADVVCRIGVSTSVDKVYAMLVAHGNNMAAMAAAYALCALPADRSPDVERGLRHASAAVRAVAAEACARGTLRPSLTPVLLELAGDPSPRVRWVTARALGRLVTPDIVRALLRLLKDEHPTVRDAAALKLGERLRSRTRWLGPLQLEAAVALRDRFAVYSAAYRGADADWGWRCTGEALQALGPRGIEALQGFLAQDDDAVLADRAWQVLYVELSGHDFRPVAPATAERDYLRHPRVRKAAPPRPKPPAEPRLMPYLVQTFDGKLFESAPTGDVGDVFGEDGRWRGIGGEAENGPIVTRDRTKTGKGRCLRLAKAEGARRYADGVRCGYRVTEGQVRVRVSVLLGSPESAVSVWMTSSSKWTSTLVLRVGPAGSLGYRTAEAKTVEAQPSVQVGQWTRLELLADLDRAVYSGWSDVDGTRTLICKDVPLKPGETYNDLVLMAAGGMNSVVWIDDVDVSVSNPAWKPK